MPSDISHDHIDPSSLHELYDQEERWERARRRHNLLSFVCGVLAAAIVAAGWYTYPILKRHEASLGGLPSLSQTVGALGDQLKQADDRVAGWVATEKNDRQTVRNDMAKLGRDVRSRIETSAAAGQQLYARLQQRVDEQLEGIRTRLTRLETSSDASQTDIASLKQQIGELRQDVTRQNDELDSVRRQIDQNGSSVNQQIAALKSSQDTQQKNIGTIQDRMAVRRLPFEVSKGRSQDVGEGVLLGVTSTDAGHERMNGWLWLSGDQKTVYLRNQGLEQPVAFYGSDGQRRELVITGVTRNSVTGYVVVPKMSAPDSDTRSAE